MNTLIFASRFLTAAWVSSCATLVLAGPINPPAGPVAPTAGPEPRIAINGTNTAGDADSLFKITAPGSYYLTSNITGAAGRFGIEIATSGVTLDLNGFDLSGVAGSFDGVIVSVTNLSNIAVINGSVRNWGDSGLDMGSSNANSCRIEGVSVSDNADRGISISTGFGHLVLNCLAYNNGTNGIFVSAGSTVSNCVAYSNGLNGIGTGQGSAVMNCTTYSNGGSGISAGTGCTVIDCTSRLNAVDGIACTLACVIRGNSCSTNGNGGDGAGIHATSVDNRIEGNNCIGADRGIDVDLAGNIIFRNTCSGNTIDWEISANNIYGPIIDRRLNPPATTTPAVSGAAATGTMGSTDPSANFTY